MNRFFIMQLFTIVLLLFYSVPNFIMPLFKSAWLQPGMVKLQTLRSEGVANILAEHLNTSSSNEGAYLHDLDEFPYLVDVLTLSELDLSHSQVDTLKERGFLVDSASLHSYKVIDANRVLIIGNPDVPKRTALSYAQREIMGVVFLLVRKVEQTPVGARDSLAKELTVHFRYPIKILPIEALSLSSDEAEQLNQGKLVTRTVQSGNEYGSGIDRFYQQLSDGSILSGGPIAPFISNKSRIGTAAILLGLGLFNALMLLLWLVPTWRSANYVNQITGQFSAQGHPSRIPILFGSLLNPQARTFNQMAARTEQLFFDNQQLIHTSSKALKQPLDDIENELAHYKNAPHQLDTLDQIEQSVNDMRDIISLILLMGKFNREKDNSQLVSTDLSQWVKRNASQWQVKLDKQVKVINHSEQDSDRAILTSIDPYYLDKAILSLLSLSIESQQSLVLHLTVRRHCSEIMVYQCEEKADIKVLSNMNKQYLLLFAQNYKGRILNRLPDRSIALEIPNVFS